MTRRFVLATDSVTADQEKALKNAFSDYGWWHWLPNFWLIAVSEGELDAEMIRNKAFAIAPNARAIVLEVEPKFWAGVWPPKPGETMTEWLRTEWEAP